MTNSVRVIEDRELITGQNSRLDKRIAARLIQALARVTASACGSALSSLGWPVLLTLSSARAYQR